MTARRTGPSLDEPALVRGASTGFTVLLLGELLSPLVSGLSPVVGLLWLSLVGAAGFVVAGSRVGVARAPRLQGSLAALAALVLTIPLRMLAGLETAQQWYAVLVSAVFGLLVGAIAGQMAGAVRDRAGT
jgi:xanthine/uracil permease